MEIKEVNKRKFLIIFIIIIFLMICNVYSIIYILSNNQLSDDINDKPNNNGNEDNVPNNLIKGEKGWFLDYVSSFFVLYPKVNVPYTLTSESLTDAEKLNIAAVYLRKDKSKGMSPYVHKDGTFSVRVIVPKNNVQEKINEMFGIENFSYLGDTTNEFSPQYDQKLDSYLVDMGEVKSSVSHSVKNINIDGENITVLFSANIKSAKENSSEDLECGSKEFVFKLINENYNFISMNFQPSGKCQ